jgi:hypothetical protein
MPTYSVVVGEYPSGEDGGGPKTALVTDGQVMWVVGRGTHTRFIAERAYHPFTPGDADAALGRVVRRSVSSYTPVGMPRASDEAPGVVAERLAAEMGVGAVQLPPVQVRRAAG